MPAAISDRRLQTAIDAVNSGRVKVLSIDVFDTLLWRKAPEPQDVFLMLAQRLKNAGRLAANLSAVQFAELRRFAETRAREKKQKATGYREITLRDIYAELPPFIFAAGFEPAKAQAAELELETSLMVLDGDVAALATHAAAKGVKVILVSDTYFSSRELSVFLSKAGLSSQKNIAQIIASNEAGKPKWRDLFDVLVPQLGVLPSEMLHIGDNMDADITPCRRLGIACIHYDKWAFSPRVRSHEFPAAIQDRHAVLSPAGDFGLTGLRSRLAHRAPMALSPELQFFWGYGAAVMAPLFAGFARWIVQSAQGADAVYGLMREGRFLKRVVDLTAEQLGAKINFQELWLSRRAVIRAGLYPEDADLIGEYVLAAPGRTTDEILTNMGLSRADLGAVSTELAQFDAAQPDAFVKMISAVLMNPALKQKIEAHSAALRPGLLKGLGKAISFAQKPRIIVVDLGYTATIQAVLQRILKREGLDVKMSGLYFALSDKAAANIMSGVDLQAYLSPDGFGGEATQVLVRTPDVLEHACMCDEGSLAGFDATGEPQLLPNRRPDKQLAEMHAMQDGIFEGVRQINALLGSLDQTPAVGNDALARQIAAVASCAMLNPTLDEARRIGAWRHEAKVDAMPTMSFTGTTFDFSRLEYGGWAGLQTVTRDQIYWPAASFQIADPSLAAAYSSGIRKAFTAEQLFSNPLLGSLTICPDRGAGFDARGEGQVSLNVNAFGRGFVSATLKPMGPDAFTRLRLTWPVARAVIQFDQVEAVFTTPQGAQKIDLLKQPIRVLWDGVSFLEAGAVLAAKQAVTILDLGSLAPPVAHSLDLELRFKYLQLDSILNAG